MEIATKQANHQLMEEKLNKESLDKELATREKLNHIEYITGHDFFTENTVQLKIFSKLVNQCSAKIEYFLIIGKE